MDKKLNLREVESKELVTGANTKSKVDRVSSDNKKLPPPDHAMANRFFDALIGNTEEGITFQFFTEKREIKAAILKGQRDKLAKHIHKKCPIDFVFVETKQAQGCGVWAMVNAGNGKGRSAKNVVKIRAFFIDLDGSPWEPAASALKPHMRVESSPGRWHLYWLVKDCELGQFKPIQQAIAGKFEGDRSCCDLPRVLRVPGFYHLKSDPVMTKLVEINDIPRYSTEQVIEGLGLDLRTTGKEAIKSERAVTATADHNYTDTDTGEIFNLKEWAAKNSAFDIVKVIDAKFIQGQIINGKQHITCPFADEHTDASQDLATFVVNATPPSHSSFTIHCMHNHCVDRDRLDFLQAMFEKGWLPKSVLIEASLVLRKPLWVTLQVKEISAASEWSILAPDERRIAWDLQYYAWLSDDGTIEDNDWKISKFLGIKEEAWLVYREILTKVGWLIDANGRLTNEIVKREFERAQMAYSKACAGGRNGGLKTQQKRREKSHLLTPPLEGVKGFSA